MALKHRQAYEDTMMDLECHILCYLYVSNYQPALLFCLGAMKYFLTLLLTLVLLPASISQAQDVFSFNETSTIEVVGASNKSDWTVKAEEFSGSVTLTEGNPTAASLQVVVASMKSGRSMIMDRLMRGSLNASDHPHITFEMTRAKSSGDQAYAIDGMLTLNGESKAVALTLVKSVTAEGQTAFTGSTILDMREYKIDPPTAMFGALITKPEVTLNFNLVLASK